MENVEFTIFGINPCTEEMYKLGKFSLRLIVKLKKAVICRNGRKEKKQFLTAITIDEDSYEEAFGQVQWLIRGESVILTLCEFRNQKFLACCHNNIQKEDEDEQQDINAYLQDMINEFCRGLEI